MTLKEKFDNPIMRHDLGRNEIEETKEQCVEIAEDFAIGFAEWLVNSWYSYNFGIKMFEHRNKEIYKTTKDLLEMFKKEKQL